jgi:hypothetical protein
MKKNVVQDVVPPKKSIRNVKLSDKREVDKITKRGSYREELPRETPQMDEDFTRPVPILKQAPMRIEPLTKNPPETFNSPSYKYEYNEPKKSSKKWFYLSSLVFILAAALGVSSLFKNATIKISPKQEVKSVSETFVAKKDVATGLSFQTVTVTKDVEKTAKATGEQKVDKKSTGKIVIYNNYNNQPQKLVATTRFQTPEGLIFRLVSPATVPGREVKDGKTVPGSVEVTVEADKPGISYNIGLKDFTIPGFKGDPKYTTIYARSKTEMTGGFSGMQKVVSKEALELADKEMKTELEQTLMKDIEAQIPANFVSYKEGLSIAFDSTVQVPDSTKEDVTLRKKAKVTAVIIDKGALSKAILAKLMPEVESETIKISNLSELSFSISQPADIEKQITFTLGGNANFVWILDENKLKTELLGLSKKSAKIVIAQYPAVSEAWIETKPFWNQTIPKDSEKVTLTNTFGQ